MEKSTFPEINVDLRLEGPYFSSAEPFRYGTVVCLVAGTGISGAIAIARAFIELRNSSEAVGATLVDRPALFNTVDDGEPPKLACKRCVVVWSVRAEDYVELPFFKSK